METVAQVLVNIPARSIHKEFSYLVPEHLPQLDVGWRVLVPFGTRQAEGFVVSVHPPADPLVFAAEDVSVMKFIVAALDEHPWFDKDMFATAQWISEHYLTTLTDALRLFIPGKSGIQNKKIYQATTTADETVDCFFQNREPLYRELWLFLKKNGATDEQHLKKQFSATDLDWKKVLLTLIRHKMVETTGQVMFRGRPRYETQLRLISEPFDKSSREWLKLRPKQQRFLAILGREGILKMADLPRWELSRDMANRLIKAGWIASELIPVIRDTYAASGDQKTAEAGTKALTAAQQQVFDSIFLFLNSGEYRSFLLHGITGSGKTQIYIEAVATVRQSGRQAIVLVPEIALTSQIINRFKERFGDDVTVIHSRLSEGERYDAWRRLRSGQSGIVIGARSAVFAPVPNLGIIVVDEEHETAYKQEESPRYHARDVAFARCRFAGAVALLGSATPSLETYYQSKQGQHVLLTLEERINNEPLPPVTIVDMRQELKSRRRGVLSEPLRQMLSETLEKQEQVILMLNRRGYSTFVMCRECGQVLKCPHCDVSLVYHASSKFLRCHYCLKQYPPPSTCPHCQSRYIKYFGTGTQKVEEELQKFYPDARVIRMDQDTTGGKLSHEQILTSFSRGDYNILLGTQMVAKGHDIPNVTGVGIISADTALNLPDFRAAERTYSLLTQVAGRAGRGGKPGQVILQTYNPEHYAVCHGAAHHYLDFYQEELEYRRQLAYPPFVDLIKIVISAKKEMDAWEKARRLATQLTLPDPMPDTELIGPYPASITRVNDVFRIHILLKTRNASVVKARLRQLELHCQPDMYVDVDPVNAI
ncbi:MAG TPA: primosomal protein N' [Patescibacteria group bacterium]|nr:primosomal protein N' [Patescibacteria group bacterium]